MITKTQQAKDLFNSGEISKALKIVKTFKVGISKDEKRTIEISNECLSGSEDFYKGLGIDTQKEVNKSIVILKRILN